MSTAGCCRRTLACWFLREVEQRLASPNAWPPASLIRVRRSRSRTRSSEHIICFRLLMIAGGFLLRTATTPTAFCRSRLQDGA